MTNDERRRLADRIEASGVLSLIESHFPGQSFPASMNPLSEDELNDIVALLRAAAGSDAAAST